RNVTYITFASRRWMSWTERLRTGCAKLMKLGHKNTYPTKAGLGRNAGALSSVYAVQNFVARNRVHRYNRHGAGAIQMESRLGRAVARHAHLRSPHSDQGIFSGTSH